MTMKMFKTKVRASHIVTIAAIVAGPAAAEPMLHAPSFYRGADVSRLIDNYIELGVGYNSGDSYRFGEWNGLREEGAYPIIGFNWLSRSRDDDARYWQITGSNLGLETRKFGLEAGSQGRWKINASADRLLRSELDSARFLQSVGLGTNNISVPVTGAITGLATTPYNIEQGRDFYRLGFGAMLGGGWDLQVNYREDVRDGTRVMGVPFGGFQFTQNVPYAIDDHTQQLDLAAGFAAGDAQLQIAYHFSRYENNLDSFQVDDPRGTVATGGRVSLMPSNDYHQITATGSLRLSPATRLTAKLSYGLGLQNDAFLPYTTGTAATPLPRTSLDGELARTLFDVALTTRPSKDSNLKLAYQYFDHDNKTPIAEYLYALQDGDQVPAVVGPPDTTARARRNAPFSWTEHKAIADGDLRVGDDTTLRALLEFSQKDYELAARKQTQTTKAGVEARRPVLDTVSGSVGYDYTRRTGSEYDRYAFINASYVNAGAAAQLTTYQPSLRAYMYNDFDQNRLRASANWIASETISLQGGVEAYRQQFEDTGCATVNATQASTFANMPDNCLGRNLADGGAFNIDLQWQPEENLTAFAFVNYTRLKTEQSGRQWAGGNTTQATSPAQDWTATITQDDQSIGTGFKWQPDEAGRWSVGGHYVFSKGVNAVEFSTGSALAETNLPDSQVSSHAVQLYAKWNFSRSTTFRLNYLYETIESDDWALLDPATGLPYGPAVAANYAWTGQSAPKYENHVVGISVALHSW